jgi:hypothetical protein
VANEVRVFPLLGLDHKWSPHVGPVRERLERAGFEVEVVAIEYEFQRAEDHAGSRIMRVRRRQAVAAVEGGSGRGEGSHECF